MLFTTSNLDTSKLELKIEPKDAGGMPEEEFMEETNV